MASKSGYIMVVEDDRLLLDAIDEKLEALKLPHKCFIKGTEALNTMIDGHEKPAVIWLDYYLGDTNGLAFMKILKGHPELKDIPVIVVSNSTGGDKIKKLMALGADEYIVKANYKLKEIIEKIQKRLPKS